MRKIQNNVGRPKLKLNETEIQKELKKYIKGEQTAVATYTELRIGKTSFYTILKKRGIKKMLVQFKRLKHSLFRHYKNENIQIKMNERSIILSNGENKNTIIHIGL